MAVAAPVVVDGPHELLLEPARPVWYAMPRVEGPATPLRLVAHLHGVCGGPSYACGKWATAAVEQGVLVCPTGNARCGDSPVGPPTWEAPSWGELVHTMDRDLERSVAAVTRRHPQLLGRQGAVLTGYSRGAYAAALLPERHPGRWPYLVLIEADVRLSAAALRRAGVEAVALVAGELGSEIAGERRTESALVRDGFRARLFVMPRTGHPYAEDMNRVMREALAFVLGDPAAAPER